MADLDYAPVVGRFGITVGDLPTGDVAADVDDNPDVLWCDEGTIKLIPLVTEMKVTGDPTTGPFTAGNAPIITVIDADTGRMTYNGSDTTWVLDLGSDKVNPRFPRDVASYRVEFEGMRCRGQQVKFSNFTFHPLPVALLPEGQTANDLTLVSPVPATGGEPIVRGPGVIDAEVVGGDLVMTFEDGTQTNAGPLPVGPGGSDAGVGSYFDDATSTTVDRARARIAADIPDPANPVGAALSTTFARIMDTRPAGPLGVTRVGLPVDDTPPAIPTGLAATPGDGTVTLGWNGPVDSPASHRVYRDSVQVAQVVGSQTVLSGQTNGVAHSWAVTAVDAAGNESARSAAVTAAASATHPANLLDPDDTGAVSGAIGSWTGGALTPDTNHSIVAGTVDSAPCLTMSPVTTSTGVRGYTRHWQQYAVEPNAAYTVLASAKPGSTTRSVFVGVVFYNAAGVEVSRSTTSPQPEVAASWLDLALTIFAPEGAAFARLYMGLSSSTPAVVGELHHFRQIGLYRGVVAPGDWLGAPAATNLLTADDSSLESSIGTWLPGAVSTGATTTSTVLARSTAVAVEGTYSLSITRNTSASGVQAFTTKYAVVAGRIYDATAYIRPGTTVRDGYVGVAFFNSVGTLLSSANSTVIAERAGAWTRLWYRVTAPVGATEARLFIGIAGATPVAIGELHYFDRMRFEEGPAAAVLSDMQSWSWWSRPRAVALAGKVYTQAVEEGDVVIRVRDGIDPDVTQTVTVADIESDDHNNGALIIKAGKPAVSLYGNHGTDHYLRCKVSTVNIESGLNFSGSSEVLINAGVGVTYAVACVHGNNIYVLFRAYSTGSPWQWRMTKSTDWGATWDTPQPILEHGTQFYTGAVLAGDVWRLTTSTHPVNGSDPNQSIYYLEMNLATGAVTTSDGTILANLGGAGLPVTLTDLELVADPPWRGAVTWVYDVGDGPTPEVVWASYSPPITGIASTGRYHYSRLVDGAWHTFDLAASGAVFSAGEEPYMGGVQIPDRTPGGRVYLAREEDGVWYVERRDTADGGQSWGVSVVGSSADRLARAWPVDNRDGSTVPEVMVEHITAWVDFFRHHSRIVALVGGRDTWQTAALGGLAVERLISTH